MIDPATITSFGAAFVAGLATSAHCVGMCGPIACILAPTAGDAVRMETLTTVYNIARIASITAVGALLGGLGGVVFQSYQNSLAHYFPWLLVGFFIFVAIGADRWLPKPKWLSRLFFKISSRFRKMRRVPAASLIGALTPLLPCGPLYMVFGLALMLGSPLKGAEFLLAFGLGTLPLLFLAHLGFGRLQARISPGAIKVLQRGMAAVMALLLVARLSMDMTVVTHQTESAHEVVAPACPMCK